VADRIAAAGRLAARLQAELAVASAVETIAAPPVAMEATTR
jgi:hypothetical protein